VDKSITENEESFMSILKPKMKTKSKDKNTKTGSTEVFAEPHVIADLKDNSLEK
jgi:hypothetical protein